MNFLRFKSSTGHLPVAPFATGQAGSWPRRTPLPAAIVVTVLCASELLAQTPGRVPSSPQPLTATDIFQYLIASDFKKMESKPKPTPAISVDTIVDRMTSANARRSAELRGFQGRRWYHLQYHGLLGGRDASMEVVATYSAPDKRDFSIVSETGSRLLLNKVLLKLLDSERQAFQNRRQFELSPANYKFELVGTERMPDGNTCYVLSVKPRKNNEFLYSGKVWVDANDFAVVRMEGEPAKSPSFWIRDTQIASDWQKIGDFWFIAHNRSVSHIRMGGTATLTIDYGDYQVTEVDHRAAKNQATGAVLPDPASITPQR